MDSRIWESIVDRGIERGEWEMRDLSRQLQYGSAQEPRINALGDHNSGEISVEGSDRTGDTPVAASKDEAPTRHDINQDDIRNRKVDPEAMRESFKEAELDPMAESEPEEGEKAA